jgi:hypothetical protein
MLSDAATVRSFGPQQRQCIWQLARGGPWPPTASGIAQAPAGRVLPRRGSRTGSAWADPCEPDVVLKLCPQVPGEPYLRIS